MNQRGQRARHWIGQVSVPLGMQIAVRIRSGRSRLDLATRSGSTLPDTMSCLVMTGWHLVEPLEGVFVYTGHDEINVLVHPRSRVYGRHPEKITSVAAGIASAAYSQMTGHRTPFTATMWVGEGVDEVAAYFAWRLSTTQAAALDAQVRKSLTAAGMTPRDADAATRGMDTAARRAILTRHGVDWGEIPAWLRNGSAGWRIAMPVTGVDPRTGQQTTSLRRQWHLDLGLPDDPARFRGMLLTRGPIGECL